MSFIFFASVMFLLILLVLFCDATNAANATVMLILDTWECLVYEKSWSILANAEYPYHFLSTIIIIPLGSVTLVGLLHSYLSSVDASCFCESPGIYTSKRISCAWVCGFGHDTWHHDIGF